MFTNDHAAKALEFLTQSDAEFAEGDRLQASEKLWGAATHAIMAAAQQRGWRHGSHRALKEAAEQLSDDHNDPLIEYGFLASPKSFTATFTTTIWRTLSWTPTAPKSTISSAASWPCSDHAPPQREKSLDGRPGPMSPPAPAPQTPPRRPRQLDTAA